MKALNKQTAPKSVAPERIIQFGEGNFLRAFVDWIVYNMNQKTDFNGSVVVVQPIEKGMAEWLNGQDCLYHVNLQGRLNGEAVNSLTRIDCISRALNPYSQNSAFMALADQPEIRFVISNTTEAGISYHADAQFDDAPPASFPAKLTRLLFERFSHFDGAADKGWVLLPCELIDYNGDALRELVLGSEGRFGVISQVKVRVTPVAEQERFYAVFLPNWQQALSAIRSLAQARVPLSMLRLSNAIETRTQLALAGHPQQIALLEKYQLRYTVEWWLSGQPFLTQRGKLVDAVVNAIEHYNEIKPQLLTTGGTSDGRFIARMGAQVVELGPVNATIHKINECVNAADLQLLARMYQRIMEQLVA